MLLLLLLLRKLGADANAKRGRSGRKSSASVYLVQLLLVWSASSPCRARLQLPWGHESGYPDELLLGPMLLRPCVAAVAAAHRSQRHHHCQGILMLAAAPWRVEDCTRREET